MMSTRRGVLTVEVVVAAALAGTLLVVCTQLLSAALAARYAADQRQCALWELGNVMEQTVARPWSDLTAAALQETPLSPPVKRLLPGAELKIDVAPSADDADAKRITAELRWQDRGRSVVSVSLTTWRYKPRRRNKQETELP